MKYQKIRKRLLLEGAVVSLILSALGSASYFAHTLQEESFGKRNTLEGQVKQVSNETNALREKYIRLQKDKDLYHTVTKLNESDMLSHTDSIVDRLFRLYTDLYSVELKLQYAQSSAVLDSAAYARKTSVIKLKDTTIQDFSAASDEDVYDLMDAIQRDFPGSVSFTGLKLTRESRLTDEALRTITKKGTFPLMRGEIKFSWFGIDPVDPEEQKKVDASRQKRRR